MNAVLKTAPRMGLSTSSILFELSISVWTGRKQDKQVSAEIDQDKHTRVRAGRYHKDLFAGCTELEDIAKFTSRVRGWVVQNTLPWSYTGPSLLPTSKMVDFNTQLEAYRDEFFVLVDKLIAVYPAMIQAASLNLGSLFDPNDYPSVDEIRHKFGFRFVYTPVPDNDFRVNVGTEEVEFLHEQYSKLIADREVEIARTNWERLYTEASRLANQLKEKGRVYDSTFDGLMALCESMDAMNVTGDNDLDRRRKEIMKVLRTTDTKQLREDVVIKKDVKREIEDILSKFNF
jgi:hypothetical protein